MFPIFWRYVLKIYFKTFFLSLSSFIAILLINRVKDIARFMVVASSSLNVLKYTLYQIPYILPIAIPISSFLAVFFLFRTFSKNSELTALRSSGFSIKKIILPLILTSFVIAIANFTIASEISPRCQSKSKSILFKQTSSNPILLLQRQNLLKNNRQNILNLKEVYVDMKSSSPGETAKDIIIILPHKSNNKLALLSARKAKVQKEIFLGDNVTLISHGDDEKENSFDTLIIENQKKLFTKANTISNLIKIKNWSISIKYYSLSTLIKKAKNETLKFISPRVESFTVEIVRRISFATMVLTFTLLGIAYGIEINRSISKKNTIIASLLILSVLIFLTSAKACKYYHYLALIFLLIPQIFITFIAILKLNKTAKGIE